MDLTQEILSATCENYCEITILVFVRPSSNISFNSVQFVEFSVLVEFVKNYALRFLKVHSVASYKCDVKKHLTWFVPQNFVELLVYRHEIFDVYVISVEVFVDFETIIGSEIEISYKSECIQSPLFISLDVWKVWICLNEVISSFCYNLFPNVTVVLLHN